MTAKTHEALEASLVAHEHRWIAAQNYETVYHVGNLEEDRVVPHHSQEGKELSIAADRTVSDAWKRIARLGGTTYELTNPAAVFYNIDAHTSLIDREVEFCVENEYISFTTGYRVANYDEDRYMLFYEQDRAETCVANKPRDATIEETDVPELAEHGREYWKSAFRQDVNEASPIGVRMLIPIWTASALNVDGIYWHHAFEPHNHSAPRGLIYQDELENWTISPTDSE